MKMTKQGLSGWPPSHCASMLAGLVGVQPCKVAGKALHGLKSNWKHSAMDPVPSVFPRAAPRHIAGADGWESRQACQSPAFLCSSVEASVPGEAYGRCTRFKAKLFPPWNVFFSIQCERRQTLKQCLDRRIVPWLSSMSQSWRKWWLGLWGATVWCSVIVTGNMHLFEYLVSRYTCHLLLGLLTGYKDSNNWKGFHSFSRSEHMHSPTNHFLWHGLYCLLHKCSHSPTVSLYWKTKLQS